MDFLNWVDEEKYKTIEQDGLSKSFLQAYFTFEDSLNNSVSDTNHAIMRQDWETKIEKPL